MDSGKSLTPTCKIVGSAANFNLQGSTLLAYGITPAQAIGCVCAAGVLLDSLRSPVGGLEPDIMWVSRCRLGSHMV